MSETPQQNPETEQEAVTPFQRILQILLLFVVIYFFMASLELMGASFKLFGKDFAKNLVATASNPFIGLFIGMLATAIIQSSSTTTSTVVAMVAAGAFGPAADPATIALAVPIIMGANIGTSVTSTIVSMGHIGSRREYRKALAAATIHDFFNIIAVSLLFPLEYFFGILSKPASALAQSLYVGGGDGGIISTMKVVKNSVKPVVEFVVSTVESMASEGSIVVAIACLLIALLMLFLSLQGLTKSLKKLIIGRVQHKIDKTLFGNWAKAMSWGFGITVLVQSSSITSSLTVPLVATGKVSLRKVFPFLIGANIGTTTTALIAALVATTAANPVAGLAIAFCHLFFNLFGAFLVFPIPQIRNIPVQLARRLGRATLKNRLVGVGYVVVTFFVIPFFLILLNQGLKTDDNPGDSQPGIELNDQGTEESD